MGTFNSLVHKQVFDEGVQDELRDKLYFTEFADVRTEDGEFIYERKGSDVPAEMTTDGNLVAGTFTYDKDAIGLTKEAYKLDRITSMETTKQGFLIKENRINVHAEALARKINREIAKTSMTNAGTVVTDGDLLTASNGGGANAVSVTTSNADEIAAIALQKLNEANALDEMPYMVMRPKDATKFGIFASDRGTPLGDDIVKKGYQRRVGMFGFDIFITNDVPYTVTHSFSANFTANDTITVRGVTFTFKATAAAAGEVAIGGSLALSLTNLQTAITGSATGQNTGTGYFEVSAANRLILKIANIDAVAGATTMVLTSNAVMSCAKVSTVTTLGVETAVILTGGRNTTVLRLPGSGFTSTVLEEVPLFSGIEVRSTRIFDTGVWSKTAPKICKIPVLV